MEVKIYHHIKFKETMGSLIFWIELRAQKLLKLFNGF